MSQRVNDFLAREAGEYLSQMQALLDGSAPVDPQELLRLARGVRGSAQLAGSEPLAAVAQRLEQGALAVAEGRLRWRDELRSLSLQTVLDLQDLLGTQGAWGAEEEARLRAALERWDPVRGGEPDAAGEEADPRVVPITELLYADGATAADVVSISDLLYSEGGATVDPIPISELLYEEAQPHGASADAVVGIDALLLRGDDALRAALALRPHLEAIFPPGENAEGAALLRELFDLIHQGRTGASDPS